MEKEKSIVENVNLDDLKEEIVNYIKHDLNEYHHENYTTQYDGSKICDFICALIDNMKELQKKVERLESENTKGFKKSEAFDQFTNIGSDEEGGPIGNCTKCGCKGVYIMEHKCK